MASPGREYPLDHHLIEHLKFSGLERDNLNDLITIVVSLKSKYGIVPLAAAAQGNPLSNALTVNYVMESGIYRLEQNHQHFDGHPAPQLHHRQAPRHPQILPVQRDHNSRRLIADC